MDAVYVYAPVDRRHRRTSRRTRHAAEQRAVADGNRVVATSLPDKTGDRCEGTREESARRLSGRTARCTDFQTVAERRTGQIRYCDVTDKAAFQRLLTFGR